MSTVQVNNPCNGNADLNDHSSNMARITQNGDKFSNFYDQWIEQQHHDLQALQATTSTYSSPTPEQENHQIQPLIDCVILNYEKYYSHKANSAKYDVKSMFSPSWISTTENMFLWVGGWRPSLAFHLLHSKSGLQLESQLNQIMDGTCTYDLSDITHSQLQQIDKLQRETIMQEREISEEMTKYQETGANKQMAEIVNIITEIHGNGGADEGANMLKPQMETRELKMEKVLERADQLRMDTLRQIINILKPLQALHFLIAAGELHLRVHEYGKSIDAQSTLAS